MTDFSERLAALTPEQRALFELRRKQKGLSEAQNQTISRRKPAPYYPLSFDQMRLWFLYQLAPHNTAYNITGAVRLTGPLNPDVLERAINEIIRRHEILRTTFANVDEQPAQFVIPKLTIKMTRVDLSHLSQEEQAIAMPRAATEFAQAPFDLVNGPLIRASLLRLAADDHILVTVMQHIVTDRWSYTLFEQELAILYHAFSNRLPSPLPELPIQFADFAIWQQQWMQSEKMQSELDFWKRKLADAPPLHSLPLDHPRPTVVSFLGGRHEVEFSPAAVAGVRSIARQSGATIFITLLTMFKVLLARESGQTDIVVGTPIANRGRPELEKLIGFFLNTLIFRSDLSANPTFREYLAQVREIASEAYARQDVPFERLVAELRPERDTSRNPLYQITFLFLDFEDPQELADLPGVKVKTVDVDTEDARFDITLALWSDPQRIYGVLEYNRDLFDPPTIAAYVEHFKLLVEQIVVDPDLRIFDIPCLTLDEERKLLVDWNATAREYPQERCVHELIAEQAARTPEAVAVVFEDRSLSYAEVDARSNQLAHHLRSLGVEAGARVGLYLQRSLDLPVALLGILKAGGTYVPLDPSYPAARLHFMLADAGIGVLVTQAALADNLPHTGVTLCLDRDAAQIAEQPETPPSSALQPEDLAYIIYTSGSTGQPKGVQIPHRALVNFLHSMRREPGMSADDTLLAVTTIAFDIAGLELFLPLTVGARIVLVDRDTAIDGVRLAALLDSSGATIMQATPATWRLLLSAGWHGTPGLRALSGGEALPLDLAQHLLPRVEQLWNLYGPTETTIWSAATRVRAEDERISLGQPIANTKLYVLDAQQRLAPVGVVGELYIGGDGIARGYNNRPDLTAERFIPDPFDETPGSRLYRTGDLVRYRYDGSLEFSGRADHQIKLRGYRIELGEIEAALRQQPEVRDVAVMVREDRSGDQRLVAYVVSEQRNKGTKEQSTADLPSPAAAGEGKERSDRGEGLINHRGEGLLEQLSTALRARLPEYMVPSAFVFLDALPLTPNGKLDRKALPAPDARNLSGGAPVAPRNSTEELVAGVWSAALGVEQIGVHDNFFALGGHSLMATQVIGRVKQLLNLDLPLRLLFEAPTVATFAGRLQAEQADAGARLQPVPRDGTPLPLSFAQQRLWFLDQLQPNSTAYNLLTAARLHGSLNLEAFRRSLSTIVQRHESLRTTFAQTEQLGAPVQVIAPTLEVPLNVVSIHSLPEAEREAALAQIVRDEVERPFDLQQGPLIRAQLVQIHAEATRIEHVLLLTIHHIVTDGWSQNVLLGELTTLYQGFVQHEPVALPELEIQYADYAIWQRNWLSGAVLEQQIDYWRSQLANLAPLDLPADYPRPPVMTYEGARTTFQIAPELTADLQRLSQQLGATLFMTLLAGFQSLLSRYSGQTDIAVGTPIAGRVRPELEELIGFFVNTLVMRTDLSGQPGFAEVVERVRTVSLGAYAHQDLPFEVVVEQLQPARDLSRSPLFQVMFALQNMPRTTIELPDLTLEPIAPEVAATQFDLSLTLAEEAGGLYGHVEYRTDLFTPATIAQLIEHYRSLLAAVVANPRQSITTLPLLADAERERLLVSWNATAAAYPQDQCLHQLVEAQVARTPEAVALRCGTATLTYAELNTRANQLAHHLQALGVGPDVRVGLCLDRSLELVIGLLGVLKAGGAYVPIDPSYPQERITFLLADAQLGALVTQAALSETLPPFAGVTV
ncbi:MAG TPA: amino acid adenylation domain-containing protein, partial [Herpetosiphonaceae bacterium]